MRTIDRTIPFSCNIIKDITTLLTDVLPGGLTTEIHVKAFIGGDINLTYKAWRGEDPDNVVVVRVYKENNSWIFDKDWIVAAMVAAHKSGCGAEVLASFTNGLVYTYAPGEVLDPRTLDDRRIRKEVMKHIAMFHAVPGPEGYTKQSTLENNIMRALDNMADTLGTDFKLRDDLPFVQSKADLTAEMTWCLAEASHVTDDLVFSHGDLSWGNILYNKDKDEVHFIDFDFSGFNHRSVDVARFIHRVKCVSEPLQLDWISDEEESDLCLTYLQEVETLAGSERLINSKEVEEMVRKVKVYKMVLSLFCLIGFVSLSMATPSEGIIRRANKSFLECYIRDKAEYLKHKP